MKTLKEILLDSTSANIAMVHPDFYDALEAERKKIHKQAPKAKKAYTPADGYRDLKMHKAMGPWAWAYAGRAVIVACDMSISYPTDLADGIYDLSAAIKRKEGGLGPKINDNTSRPGHVVPTHLVLNKGTKNEEVVPVTTRVVDLPEDFNIVAGCTSTEEVRYYLNGVFIDVSDIAATDGHRLAFSPIEPGDLTGLMTNDVIKVLTKAGVNRVTIHGTSKDRGHSGRYLTADLGAGVTLTASMPDITYPDWRRVLPSEPIVHSANFNLEDILPKVTKADTIVTNFTTGQSCLIGGEGKIVVGSKPLPTDKYAGWCPEYLKMFAIKKCVAIEMVDLCSGAWINGRRGLLVPKKVIWAD